MEHRCVWLERLKNLFVIDLSSWVTCILVIFVILQYAVFTVTVLTLHVTKVNKRLDISSMS